MNDEEKNTQGERLPKARLVAVMLYFFWQYLFVNPHG